MKYGYFYEIKEIDWYYRRLEPNLKYTVVRYLGIRGQPEPSIVGVRRFESLEGAQRYVREMQKKDEDEQCISENARNVGLS